jgi:hypothetical protein
MHFLPSNRHWHHADLIDVPRGTPSSFGTMPTTPGDAPGRRHGNRAALVKSFFLAVAVALSAACTVRFNPPPDLTDSDVGGPGAADNAEVGEDDASAGEEHGGEDGEAGEGGGEGEAEGGAVGGVDPGPCVPTVEVCDGVDDDCDGAVDESNDEEAPVGTPLARPCYGAPPATDGVGECHAGARVCEAGAYEEEGDCPNQVMPESEAGGDALDNDCDGLTDEGFSSLTFDGRFDSRVTLPANRSLSLADTSFTIESWVRPDEISYFRSNTIASRRLEDGSEGWLFGISGRGNFDGLAKRTPFFLVDGWPDDAADAGRFLSAGPQYNLGDGQWHHVAVVLELERGDGLNHRLTLYVDGEVAATDDQWDRPPHDTARIPDAWLGADQTVLANSFDGLLAEVRITADARYVAPFEPTACPADAPDAPFTDKVVGHWRLSEGSGTAAVDASPHALHGELNSVRWQVGQACEARQAQ